MSQYLLHIENLSKSFSGVRAITRVGLTFEEGELISVIGPNGAGKTTLFNLITGVYKPDEGTILFDGGRIDGLAPHHVARLGIARTFQNLRLFKELRVWENIAVHANGMRDVHLLLERVGLQKVANTLASSLPYGLQRRCELARALSLHPRLLLLDEPTAGMNPAETEQLISLIKDLNREGLSILLIEHDMKVVMHLSSHIIVLDYGEKIAEGEPDTIRKDPKVIEAYLGKDYA